MSLITPVCYFSLPGHAIVVKTEKSCAFGPTIQTDPPFSVTFLKPGPRLNKIKMALCVFVFVFLWMPKYTNDDVIAPHQEGNLRVP